MPRSNKDKIAIIGGGIAGMYCAYILGMKGYAVTLYEATNRLGGRIRSIRLKSIGGKMRAEIGEMKPGDAPTNTQGLTGTLADIEFYAEFGPMRIELEKQILLRGLIRHLGIREDFRNLRERTEPALTEFPAYASPSAVNDPKYQLKPIEEGKSPIELLQLALLRVMLELNVEPPDDNKDVQRKSTDKDYKTYAALKEALVRDVHRAAATGSDTLPVFSKWLRALSTERLFDIQCHGRIHGTPLYVLGFWNLLSDYLSHDAILKIRDLGTFYHLLPENPNAAEWLTWWLNGLSISDNLQGIFGGMSSLVEFLERKLEAMPLVTIERGRKVSEVVRTDNGLFDVKSVNRKDGEGFHRVVFALPKVPLKVLAAASPKAFDPEKEHIAGLLGSALDFPMVKVFVVVKERWWDKERMANRNATRVPTRELHYWPARLSDRYGMIMFYTDRPATSFWANYVPPGEQADVYYKGGANTLPAATETRLLDKIVQYLRENNAPDLKREDILWYGIRDWGREPYGAANHCWRPERLYWKVMGRLGEISANHGDDTSVHVCGEAYSDYHGFIEGSLRSAIYALHRITEGDKEPDLEWLMEKRLLASAVAPLAPDDHRPEKEKSEDAAYLKAIEEWIADLNSFRGESDNSYIAAER